jgi:hemolysin activation/secretion protein
MKPTFCRRTLAFSLLLLSHFALAQTPPPPDAGRTIQETRPLPPPSPERPAAPVIEQRPDEAPLAVPGDGTLLVRQFRFEDAEHFSEEELQAAVADFTGRALSMREIEAAAERVTRLYRNHGYLVARAYVPRQDAADGALTLRVVVGQYGKITRKNASLVRDGQIAAYFSGLSGAVTRDALERAMLLTGDLPGASLPKVGISPGEAPGTSDFEVEIAPGPRFAGYAVADNYGSRYTGKNRLSVGATLNSPFRLGDALGFSGMGSDKGDLLNGRLSYSLPLGASGLRAEAAFARTTYELGKEYATLDAQGRADSLEAGFSYPLLRERAQNLTLRLDFAGRKLRDEILSDETTKKTHAATLGVDYERYTQLGGRDAYFSAGLSATAGRLKIDERDKRAFNKAGADTAGSYGRANLSLSGRLALTRSLSLSANLEAQYAFQRNLDSSEQMVISGARGVTAYRDTVSGDNGALFSLEARYALPETGGARHALSLFADAGHVRLHDASYSTLKTTYRLHDAGLGYTLGWRDFFLRARAARALGSRPDEMSRDARTRFLLMAGFSF